MSFQLRSLGNFGEKVIIFYLHDYYIKLLIYVHHILYIITVYELARENKYYG